jgi:hypothetical protein
MGPLARIRIVKPAGIGPGPICAMRALRAGLSHVRRCDAVFAEADRRSPSTITRQGRNARSR